MPLFGSNKRTYDCRIILLDGSEQKYVITSKTYGDELLAKVFFSLDLYEKEYFGLRYKDRNGQPHWLDLDKPIKKQVINYDPPYTFHFGVKFYAADPTKLREEITRYQFLLQIKKDILLGRIPCNVNTSAELCAYSVQSELGDYDANLHTDGFISEFRFVPEQTEEFESLICETYPKLRGLQPAEAELKFLERVKWLEMYGVDLYPVRGQDHMEYLLGLTPTGIVLFKNKNKIGSFIWPKITKLKYKGTCFLLRATQGKNDEEKEYTFICSSKDYAKRLWKCCAEHHTFFRLEKANDVPASAYNFLFRKGSGFKFSGRTQQEIERDLDQRPRSQPLIHRRPSQRHSRRSNGNTSYSDSDTNKNLSPGLTRVQGPVSPISNASTISAPWDAAFSQQSGLYSNGQRNSFPKKANSISQDRGTSPKFTRRSGYSSTGEGEQKRKRSHYYSGYTSASDVESQRKTITKYGSAPNVQYKGVPSQNSAPVYHQHTDMHDSRHHRHHSRDSLPMVGNHPGQYHTPNGYDPRQYRPSGSKSDSEETSRLRRYHHRHHNSNNAHTDNEMVPALDVYHNSMGVALNDNQRNPRRHRHHHVQHRQHRHQRHSGYDPNQAELLLELGPDSTDGVASGSEHVSRAPSMSDKENVYLANGQPHRVHIPTGHVPHSMMVQGQQQPAHKFIHQYLPPHLLKQGRPPMVVMHGGMQPVYRPQYVEQVIGPGRKIPMMPNKPRNNDIATNYNVPTEL